MSDPHVEPTSIVTGIATGAVATIFGPTGPSGAFLGALAFFALGGAWARLFWDATTGTYSLRRQLGFVGLSVVTALTTAMCLWDQASKYPTFLMGISTFTALIGPADALRLLRRLALRVLGVRDDGQGGD